MCTVRPACRKSPAWRAIYSGALPTVDTDATVIEDPGGACVTADELPEVWQPGSSMAVATPHPATRARARLQRHTGPQPACTTFITPQAPGGANIGNPGHPRHQSVLYWRHGRGTVHMRQLQQFGDRPGWPWWS